MGTAELFVGEKTSGMKGLPILFDSGSTYTYFSAAAYKLIVSLVRIFFLYFCLIYSNLQYRNKDPNIWLLQLMNDIQGKQLNTAEEDKTLPICWKGSTPFKSVQDIRNLFKPIALSFSNSRNVRFQIDPEGYLIVTVRNDTKAKKRTFLFSQLIF